jgi:hypothetical protein
MGKILSLRQIRIFEISIKFLIFFTSDTTNFKKKNFYLSEGPFLTFLDTKPQLGNMAHNVGKRIFSNVLRSHFLIQN